MSKDCPLQLLSWDTAFLGFGTGRLTASNLTEPELQALLHEARRRDWRLLYWSVDPYDTGSLASARQAGTFLAEEKIVYQAPPSSIELTEVKVTDLEPLTQLTPEIIRLAQQSGEFSRFRLDPHFAAGVFEALYTQWITNAVAGQHGQRVFGYSVQPGQPPAGLVTLEYNAAGAFIGLLAVQGAARGQGIGRQLLARCGRELPTHPTRPVLTVATQAANTAACAFYERCGFVEVRRSYTFHCWL